MNLTDFIRRDLEALLVEGGPLPFKWTLSAIARHYEVSLMPVRGAVEALIRDEFLNKDANGRLSVHPRVRDLIAQGAQVERPTPPSDLEQEILGYVIRLSLLGQEDFLREEATAERFQAGRSIVRRLLSRLAGAGFLEHVPRRGFRVRPYREEDMIDFVEIREVLERKALALAYERLDPGRLRRLLEANRRGARGEPRIDNRLHELWIEGSRNRYIRSFFELHRPYYQALFDYATVAGSATEDMARQHCEILEALLERNLPGAMEALGVHIRAQRPVVLRLITGYRDAHQS